MFDEKNDTVSADVKGTPEIFGLRGDVPAFLVRVLVGEAVFRAFALHDLPTRPFTRQFHSVYPPPSVKSVFQLY